MSFRSLYRHGFARVAACSTRTTLADPAANAEAVLRVARDCHSQGVALAVFPELGLSSYAIGDLLHQSTLLDTVEQAVNTVIQASHDLMPLLLVGAPLRHLGALYNCALAIHRGRLLGVVPKLHLPNYREFYETRHFVSGDATEGEEITVGPHTAPFGIDLLFAAADLRGFVVHP
jgi:NAD+ synthase (glutamine-hydrolysing)